MPEEKTTEQIQYEKLTSLFKTYAGFLTTFAGILSALTIYFTYSDRNAIKADYKETIKELKEEIAELKTDSKESIDKINKNAENELQKVGSNTNRIALDETQKQLSYIFGTDKIQTLIEKEAIKEVKGKVIEIVEDETKNFSKILDAASKMRLGYFEGYRILKSYTLSPNNSIDKANATQLLNSISEDYYTKYSKDYYEKEFNEDELNQFYNNYKFLPEKRNTNDLIIFLVEQINNSELDLTDISDRILMLSKISNQKFIPFEIDKINNWFINWKKTYKSEKKL
jgi:type I site-specific restriction-modification system R (restriction) subunit